MAGLTTHILDTHGGVPAAGVAITLRRITDGKAQTLAETVTNADGRTDAPLLTPEATQPGLYEIDFAIGPYFRGRGVALPAPAFQPPGGPPCARGRGPGRGLHARGLQRRA